MRYFEDIAKAVKYVRIQRHIDQATAAEESGISLRTLQNIETGKHVNTSSLFSYLEYLGLLSDILATLPNPDQPTPMEMLSAQKKKEQPQRVRKKAPTSLKNTNKKSDPNKKQALLPKKEFVWGDEK